MTENEISYIVRKCIFNVYNQLGPGLLESIYQNILIYELEQNGLNVKSEVKLPVYYDNKKFDLNFKIDILVEEKVVLELKSVKELEAIHYKQLYTYLKLSDKKLGILINFNTTNIIDSIKRVVNNL
ncbi:GxxExxY protein [Chryseobacterium carnipullorum]|uniref:GxxExxY protein n=1 Tax=Chryseobacterium carnipullorum TaxID=1124835 RepID=A0A1M7GX43_CHRCU|nr:GxxExxY protein [Chryseobacterium carnipullorum]AZA51014.1 GxxExxY protein [Chryseobacterium carnipullorum]AZA65874.1 GxxExxY protein [Chryseobacterium carnipullorum]SHM20738.1 GxxExxY protein [Chryseobacterium carnipullorum]STD03898.1 GxxExxY protein [Chryseobacterium carnipullorum]